MAPFPDMVHTYAHISDIVLHFTYISGS